MAVEDFLSVHQDLQHIYCESSPPERDASFKHQVGEQTVQRRAAFGDELVLDEHRKAYQEDSDGHCQHQENFLRRCGAGQAIQFIGVVPKKDQFFFRRFEISPLEIDADAFFCKP